MDIIAFFEEVAHNIHDFEDKAKLSLAEGRNDEYIKIMAQKAQTLASLPIEIKKYSMSALDEKAKLFLTQKINQFSSSAKNAQHFKSTWYMSQLLFDEDYKDGEPNNFDLFFEKLKSI